MNTRRILFPILSMLGILCGLSAEDASVLKFKLDAFELEKAGQLDQIRFFAKDNVLKLNDMVLIEDDAAAIGRPKGATDRSWFERLQSGIRVRKVLVLEYPRVSSGFLVFNGLEAVNNEVPLYIDINGTTIIRPPSKYAHPYAREYYTREWASNAEFDNWFRVEIPVGALKKGENEITLWAESEKPGWEIMVAADGEYARGSETQLHHPNRSAKSRDGGTTWDFDRLGWKDEIDGEYCIRLSLDRNAPQGTYISPVIDLFETPEEAGKESIKKLLNLEEATVSWDVERPEGTDAEILSRLGSSAVPGSSGWGEFEPVQGLTKAWNSPRGRYLQFKAVLKTTNPLATPVFKGIAVDTKAAPAGTKSGTVLKLVSVENHPVVRPSVPFAHEDFAKLRDWRTRFELDKVVAGAATEFEKQLKLMRWAYEIPIKGLDPYDWRYDDLPILKKDAGGKILMDTAFQEKGRRRSGHCLYCNLTLIGACLAMGYPARWVNIATMSTYGHEVAEVWSNDFNKWIFLDATRDYYIYDPETGIPMNLVEINERLSEIIPMPVTWESPLHWIIPDSSTANEVRIAYREGKNKFSVKELKHGPELLLYKGHLNMVLRNDFASRSTPVPWRLSSNWGGPLFYGYFGEKFPRKKEYALHTDRRQDFNPPLNQARITVSETETPGILRVDADTETPCFQTFVTQADGGTWRDVPGTSLEWKLHEGLNTLAVRVRNSAGVLGPASKVSVVRND